MSNETSTINRPPKRSRAFCLTTYLEKSQIADVLLRHDKQIRAYAYIEHNRDLNSDGTAKERHCHILLKLINAISVDNVRNWFKGYEDINGLPVNTLAQPMHDISSSFEYLTHETEQAKAENKTVYSKEEIISNDIGFFQDSTLHDEDNISLALAEMCEGIPLQKIAKKYGRDFIIHYQSIKLIFNDIQKQCGGVQL